MGKAREIPFETLTHGREEVKSDRGICVTHDTVTAAGYAEQCGGAHLP